MKKITSYGGASASFVWNDVDIRVKGGYVTGLDGIRTIPELLSYCKKNLSKDAFNEVIAVLAINGSGLTFNNILPYLDSKTKKKLTGSVEEIIISYLKRNKNNTKINIYPSGDITVESIGFGMSISDTYSKINAYTTFGALICRRIISDSGMDSNFTDGYQASVRFEPDYKYLFKELSKLDK